MRVLPYVLGHHTSAPGAALLLSGEGRNLSRGCRGVGGQISGELRPRYPRQGLMRGKFAGDETGGEWVKTGRKPSKTAELIAANSTQKSVSNAC